MAENPNPTRMELILARNRIKLAKKGHKLLKQKRDVLIMEFFKILSKAQDLREELNAVMAEAYRNMAIAQAYHSRTEVEGVAMAIDSNPAVSIEVKNVMGLKIPTISAKVSEMPLMERGYSIIGSSAKIDAATESFLHALVMIVRLAETENALRKLIREIEKTKRRVNALEYVLIPKIEAQAASISFRLQEMERDSFVMLKTIKRKIDRKEEEQN
jgi:V/A-type H+-transporting ATPase subunit D